MSTVNKTIAAALLGLGLSGASFVSSAAVDWTWNFFDSNCVSASGCLSNTTSNGNAWTYNGSAGAPQVTARAWANSGTGGVLQTAKVQQYGGSGPTTNGLGVRNRGEGTGSPNHSMDNSGFIDSVLFDFGQLVTLQEATIGWRNTDSDITLMAFTGAGNPISFLNGGNTYSDMTLAANGWVHVQDVGNMPVDSAVSVNGGELASSYWLISAFNNQISSAGWTSTNDYMKIFSLAGSSPQITVPEPGSLFLLGLTLPLLAWSRRRRV